MKQNIALVLSSGGARGFAHIGVIDELERQGFNITSIAGTSMGALVGGMYACDKFDVYKKWVCSLTKLDLFNLVDFNVGSSGIIKGKRIIKELKKMIPDENIENLKIPFTAIATNISDESEVIFSEGSLYDAIRASISIPSVFVPYRLDGMVLIDGSVLNPVPIDKIKRTTNDLVVVVNVNALKSNGEATKAVIEIEENNNLKHTDKLFNRLNSITPRNKKDSLGYFNLLAKTSGMMLNRISELTLERNKPDILINITREAFNWYEFHKAKEIIDLGKNVAKDVLENRKLNFNDK